jgi:hypothetical protein
MNVVRTSQQSKYFLSQIRIINFSIQSSKSLFATRLQKFQISNYLLQIQRREQRLCFITLSCFILF